ncbi:MAG: hypothetical protein WBG46_02470 [Nonlabens sp.]
MKYKDETEHLLSTEVNKIRLFESIEQANKGQIKSYKTEHDGE